MNSGRSNWNGPMDDYALEGNDPEFKENGYLHVGIETNIEGSICSAICYDVTGKEEKRCIFSAFRIGCKEKESWEKGPDSHPSNEQ